MNRLALMTGSDWRDGGFRQRRPSAETLAWVAASMGRGSRIVGYRRLTGGVCSAVNRLTVERRGMRTFVVLRQYPGGLGLQGSLEKEIANLGVVAGSGLPVPGILATDVAGASTGGAPSLLMTRLQGHEQFAHFMIMSTYPPLQARELTGYRPDFGMASLRP